jgi:predicted small lipoprotein YifL
LPHAAGPAIPELPPAAAAGTQDAAAQDEQSRPVEDKPFILDPLI